MAQDIILNKERTHERKAYVEEKNPLIMLCKTKVKQWETEWLSKFRAATRETFPKNDI